MKLEMIGQFIGMTNALYVLCTVDNDLIIKQRKDLNEDGDIKTFIRHTWATVF